MLQIVASLIDAARGVIYDRHMFIVQATVHIRTLKLSNIGPGYYLYGRPSRKFQVLLAPIPPPCG